MGWLSDSAATPAPFSEEARMSRASAHLNTPWAHCCATQMSVARRVSRPKHMRVRHSLFRISNGRSGKFTNRVLLQEQADEPFSKCGDFDLQSRPAPSRSN